MKAWEKLPDDLKEIVKVAMHETILLYNYKAMMETKIAMKKLQDGGQVFITWPKEDMAKVEAARVLAMEKYAKRSPLAQEVFNSKMETLRILGFKQ
jgi:TRAP-type mannitol/chloroaromatic compound transport system substrate-binding protein